MDEKDAEHLEAIKQLNTLILEAADEYDAAKRHAKETKDHWEGLQIRLSSLIANGLPKPDPQQELAFTDEEGGNDD